MQSRLAFPFLIPWCCTVLAGPAATDSTGRDEFLLRNLSETADWVSTLPGTWTRSLGSPGQTANLRIQGGELSQSRIFLDGHPLIDPFSSMTDLNLIPLESIDRIAIHSQGGTCESAEGIRIETREIPGQKPYTRFVYKNHVFRGATGMDLEHIDVTFGQHVTRKIRFSSGITSRKSAEEYPGLTSRPQLLRAKVHYSPSPAVRFDYAAYNAVLENDMPYSVRMPADTLILYSPARKQSRTDHLGDIHVNWKGMRNSLSITHSHAAHELKDLSLSARSVFPARMTRLQWTQGPDSLPVSWGLAYQDEALTPAGRPGASQHFWEVFLGLRLPAARSGGSSVCRENDGDMRSLTPGNASADRFSRDSNRRIGFESGIQWNRISGGSDWEGLMRIGWQVLSPFGIWASIDRQLRYPSLGEIAGIPYMPAPFDRADLFYLLDTSLPILANRSLKPEAVNRFQIGADWRPGLPLKISILGYMREAGRLIILQASGGNLIYGNRGSQQVTGAQASAEVKLFGLRAAGTFNYMKAVDTEDNPLYERPSFWGCVSLTWEKPFFGDDLLVRTGLSGRFTTGYWILMGSSLRNVQAAWVPQASVMDFRTTLVFLKDASFTMAADNVLNVEVSPYPGLFMPGRTLRLEVDWVLFD